MEEQNNTTTQTAEKAGLSARIKGWFASPDGMQTLKFVSAVASFIIIGIIITLIVNYNSSIIIALIIDILLSFLLGEYFIMAGRLKKSETKGYIDPFTAAFMLALNSYFCLTL